MSGLKGQGQPCSEPLKFLHFYLVFGKNWAWAQVSVHQSVKIPPSFFVFVMKKQEKELAFLQEKNKKHVKIKGFLFYCDLCLQTTGNGTRKKALENQSSGFLTS